jgi:hypothetical protein
MILPAVGKLIRQTLLDRQTRASPLICILCTRARANHAAAFSLISGIGGNQIRARTGQIELHAMHNSQRHRQGRPAFHLVNNYEIIIDSLRQKRSGLVISRSPDDRGDARLGRSSIAVKPSRSFLV